MSTQDGAGFYLLEIGTWNFLEKTVESFHDWDKWTGLRWMNGVVFRQVPRVVIFSFGLANRRLFYILLSLSS